MKPLLRFCLVLSMACALAACGVRSAYNNLDWLMMRWVNQQITLEPAQDLAIRSALDEQLAWHCRTQLPAYVAFLEQVREDLADEHFSVEDMQSLARQLATFGRTLVDQVNPVLIDMLATLSDAQLVELADNFSEWEEEYRADRIDADQQDVQDDQVRSMERGLRRFIGRISNEQRDRLRQWSEETLPTATETLAQRQGWQASFEALMQRRDQPEFEEQMAALLQPASTWTADYEALMSHNRDRTIEALFDVISLASPRQLSRLDNRLQSFVRDFERLSCID